MVLGIRFSKASIPDLKLPLPAPGTALPISAIKRQIRKSRATDTAKRRLRLIYAGRVLSDSTDFAKLIAPSTSEPSTESQQRSSTSPPTSISPVSEHSNTSGEENVPFTIWLHCSVGDILTDEELDQENDDGPIPSTLPQPVGFDRLRAAGFSERDIANIRQQFTRIHEGSATGDPIAARQLEERWMDEGASATDTLPDGSPVGLYEDLFLGAVVGFFLGFVSLFFLREGSIFSKRQQMAIIAGLIINISFAILRVYY
ncbi:DUF2407 C-terminal domain-containing protein [Dipodascopsis uninucleata]